jgi:radical SAM superfamily enzyme YgiQ (UPF0313 family)
MKQLVYIIQTPPFWLKTPPLSLIYLKTHLERQGIAVKISDLNLALFKLTGSSFARWLTLNKDFEENLFSEITSQYPEFLAKFYKDIKEARYIGFSLLGRNAHFSFSLAKQIKMHFPDKKIIFGGPHTLILDRQNRLDKGHYWVIGEGEIPFSEIVRGEKKKIYRFCELENLDTIPLYDYTPLSFQDYSQTLPILSSRGCPHFCNFCSERLLYKKLRYHSPEYMVDQIKHLKVKYKTNSFVFLDSLINYSQKWLQRFCTLIIANKLNIKWEAQIRIKNNFPLELAKLLKISGCYNLFVGLESGSNEVLKLMNKDFLTYDAQDFFQTLKRANLHFEISLILGYPGESEKAFKETLSFIVRNKKIIPKIAQVNPFTDYLDSSNGKTILPDETKNRVDIFLEAIEKEKIRYTKSFINNLIYK